MQRREFLKVNAALTASLILPKAVFSQSESCKKSTYTGNVSGDNSDEYWGLTGKLCEKITKNFDTANKEDKIFELNVRYYANGVSKGQTKTGAYKFLITSIKSNDQTKTAICKAKCQSVDKSGYTFPKSMFKHKRITLTMVTTTKEITITIQSKQGVLGKVTRTLSSSSSGSGDDGCYLTTACVTTKNLADDCHELQTLRGLRNQYMKNTAIGKSLLKDYDDHAPALVQRINTFENKDEIYQHMYEKMILPSVELAANGQYEEAISLYKTFSQALYIEYMQ